MEESKLIDVVKLAGMLVLENGGETFRAEETVVKICNACGYADVEILALPTGFFVTLSKNHIPVYSFTKRVTKRTINLYKLEQTNQIARDIICGTLPLEEAFLKLRAVAFPAPLPENNFFSRRCFSWIFAGCSTFFFTLLYGGGIFDSIIAFFCGFFVQWVATSFKRTHIYHFAISMIGGSMIALFAICSVTIFQRGNIDKIIIGGIIPLLPGLSMTNAIRDTMMGDLVSGSARFSEVLLVATAIAAGVGVILYFYVQVGGILT